MYKFAYLSFIKTEDTYSLIRKENHITQVILKQALDFIRTTKLLINH